MDPGTENRKKGRQGKVWCGRFLTGAVRFRPDWDSRRARGEKFGSQQAWQAHDPREHEEIQLIGTKRPTCLGCHLKDAGTFPTRKLNPDRVMTLPHAGLSF
jgi:hypothetical protein